jgi:hypothetical protein
VIRRGRQGDTLSVKNEARGLVRRLEGLGSPGCLGNVLKKYRIQGPWISNAFNISMENAMDFNMEY